MSNIELKSEHTTQSNGGDFRPHVARDHDDIKPRIRVVPILITLGTVAAAILLAWATWQTYMGAPWTRDGTVRAYVVTMAPEVAGRIVKLSVADNQFVHKGDDLFEIDPADYRIALEQAQAQAERDGAALDYARANENRQARLAKEGWASTEVEQTCRRARALGELLLDDAGPRRRSTSKPRARCINRRGSSLWTRPPSPRRNSISGEP